MNFSYHPTLYFYFVLLNDSLQTWNLASIKRINFLQCAPMVVSHDPIIFSVFPLSRRLSSYQWLSMEVCGVFLKTSFLVFIILPLRLWLLTPLRMNEWSFNHLRASSSSSSSSSSASQSPSSLSSTSRAGGQSGEREPRRSATADGRPTATCPQHAHPGQVRRGRVHGWTHGRGRLRRRGQHWVRPAAEIPVHETPVSWTVCGWDRVLRRPHRPAHPHPEGNQEITVGHWIRWVSNPGTAALKAALVVFQVLSVWDLVVQSICEARVVCR